MLLIVCHIFQWYSGNNLDLFDMLVLSPSYFFLCNYFLGGVVDLGMP